MGQSRFERQQIFDGDGPGRARFDQVVQRHRIGTAASFVPLLMASVIDQQPSHGLCSQREAMRPPLPLVAAIVLQA